MSLIKNLSTAVLLILLIGLSLLMACSQNRPIAEEVAGQFLMQYNIPADRPLQYSTSGDFAQTMEVQGQKFDIKSSSNLQFSVNTKQKIDNDYQLKITIDQFSMAMTTPRGEITPKVDEIIGRSFTMKVSPEGDEYDLEEAEALKYELVPGRELSMSSSFQNFFPDLAGKALMIGESWVSIDTATEKSESGEVLIIFENNNTIAGYEKVNGVNCLKIEVNSKGVISGTSHEQGMDFISTGDLVGTENWYFDINRGIFIKSIASGTGNSLTIGPNDIKIPATREFSMTTELK